MDWTRCLALSSGMGGRFVGWVMFLSHREAVGSRAHEDVDYVDPG